MNAALGKTCERLYRGLGFIYRGCRPDVSVGKTAATTRIIPKQPRTWRKETLSCRIDEEYCCGGVVHVYVLAGVSQAVHVVHVQLVQHVRHLSVDRDVVALGGGGGGRGGGCVGQKT
jgi:hypothetical protein